MIKLIREFWSYSILNLKLRYVKQDSWSMKLISRWRVIHAKLFDLRCEIETVLCCYCTSSISRQISWFTTGLICIKNWFILLSLYGKFQNYSGFNLSRKLTNSKMVHLLLKTGREIDPNLSKRYIFMIFIVSSFTSLAKIDYIRL